MRSTRLLRAYEDALAARTPLPPVLARVVMEYEQAALTLCVLSRAVSPLVPDAHLAFAWRDGAVESLPALSVRMRDYPPIVAAGGGGRVYAIGRDVGLAGWGGAFAGWGECAANFPVSLPSSAPPRRLTPCASN